MNRPFPSRIVRRERGAALIIILAFVAILTVLLTAFFSRALLVRRISSTSAAASRADQIAQTGLGLVVGDLRQEIAAGSQVMVSNGVTIYLPNSAYDSVPARLLTTGEDNMVNVLRRSMRASTFQPLLQALPNVGQYTNFPTNNLASAVSTTNPTGSGRTLSFTSWNKPQLITAATTNSFKFPDWVLVTRNGPHAFTNWDASVIDAAPGNTNHVVGRYSYVVYDEGGLLDVTVAGHPSGGIPQSELSRRSNLALADLTQIPGISNADTLIKWRNAATFANPYSTSTNSSATNSYFGWVTNSTTTFLQVNPGDQTFLSRQDLINYVTNNPSALSTNALPYLGTFSREVNAPSFDPVLTNFLPTPVDPSNGATARPILGASGVASDSATVRTATFGQDKIYNPPLANIRWPKDATLPDGTVVKAGTPLLRERFPLDRLGLLNAAGAVPAADSNLVYRYFGLSRASATSPWTYGHGDPIRIMTLPELASEISSGAIPARDPDFFELLQAGIALGSLGRDAGSTSAGGSQGMLMDQNVYAQILQIGANIIDQADTDSYPTEIDFSGFSVYGIENLPYISSIIHEVATDNSTPGMIGGWFVFVLWNPHQNFFSSANPASTGPTKLRIVPDPGSAALLHAQMTGDTTTGDTATTVYPSNINSGTYELDFSYNNTATTNSASFVQPTLLSPTNSAISLSSPSSLPQMQAQSMGGGTEFQGMFVADRAMKVTDTLKSWSLQGSPYMTFDLQYQLGGAWYTYSKVQYLQDYDDQTGPDAWTVMDYFNPAGASSVGGGAGTYYAWKVDPRSDRWSAQMAEDKVSAAYGTPNHSSTMNPGDLNGGLQSANVYMPAASAGFTNLTSGFINNLTYNSETATPAADYPSYKDPDGVVRRAVGMFASATAKTGSDPTGIYGYPLTEVSAVSRPVILNRPFRSVGELGYVDRGMPWKNIDFYSSRSGDSALLDIFTIDQQAPLVAGRINLNTRNPVVLQSLLAGALENELTLTGTPSFSATYLNTNEASVFAKQLVAVTAATPFHNRSDLVNRLLVNDTATPPTPDTWGASYAQLPVAAAEHIVERRETALRSVNDALNSRTWNLLIDLVAQSGRYVPGSSSLSDFTIEGERRYWLHVAIDRYTGQVVDEQIEAVNQP